MANWRPVERGRQRDGKMRPVTFDDNGTPLQKFIITASIAGYEKIEIEWEGDDVQHAHQSFIEWLDQQDWHTLRVQLDGSVKDLTFRTSWVAGFTTPVKRGR